jgi:hypothetical protein
MLCWFLQFFVRQRIAEEIYLTICLGQDTSPGKFILKDITRWKKDITLPDVEKYDWEKIAGDSAGVFPVDRDKAAFAILCNCGPWERLAALMGFEGAMIAMMEEPEATFELLSAITDYKIALAKKAAKYFKPDTFINFDDIATQRNLFMSPETYRQLIKPQHARLNKAVRELGLIPVQHTCGHAELCVTTLKPAPPAGIRCRLPMTLRSSSTGTAANSALRGALTRTALPDSRTRRWKKSLPR